jgi:hypothetical protein
MNCWHSVDIIAYTFLANILPITKLSTFLALVQFGDISPLLHIPLFGLHQPTTLLPISQFYSISQFSFIYEANGEWGSSMPQIHHKTQSSTHYIPHSSKRSIDFVCISVDIIFRSFFCKSDTPRSAWYPLFGPKPLISSPLTISLISLFCCISQFAARFTKRHHKLKHCWHSVDILSLHHNRKNPIQSIPLTSSDRWRSPHYFASSFLGFIHYWLHLSHSATSSQSASYFSFTLNRCHPHNFGSNPKIISFHRSALSAPSIGFIPSFYLTNGSISQPNPLLHNLISQFGCISKLHPSLCLDSAFFLFLQLIEYSLTMATSSTCYSSVSL